MASALICNGSSVFVRDPLTFQSGCYEPCGDFVPNSKQWQETYKDFSFWFNGVVLSCVIVFGLAGIVFLSSRKTTSKWLVRMVCFWDAMFLVSVLGFIVSPNMVFKKKQSAGDYGPACHFIQVFKIFNNVTSLACTWQLILAVLHKSREENISREQQKSKVPFKFIGLLIPFVAIAICSPAFFESETTQCYDLEKQTLYPKLTTKDFAHDPTYDWLVHRIPHLVFGQPTPLILMTIVALTTKMHEHNTVWLIAKFIVLTLFPVSNHFIELFSALSTEVQLYLSNVSNLLLGIQSATNWLLLMQWVGAKPKRVSKEEAKQILLKDPKLFDAFKG